jgi:DNA repair protein XRS2
MCSKLIRIGWNPVVLSFSFTAKELRADPWTRLRDSLEQLDIKYSADYGIDTTYVVSKKRNTSKGLQALINGKYIVADSFINAIVDAATVPEGAEEGTPSALEEDVETAWPNAIDHLPPRGEEPVERSSESYSPDERRQEVFDGYTFVFYEPKQYENLFPVITAGRGKALLREVIPGKTDIDDFIRYVKGVAGEKGLGSFEDGSEGRGVVVVRYTPKGEDYEWFAQFLTSVAQRLDHRPVDQREFLEAILACDASMLRRPLEEASQPASAGPGVQEPAGDSGDRMEVDQPADQPADQPQSSEEAAAKEEPAPRKTRGRRAGRSRFKGFDFDDAEEPVEETPPVENPAPPQAAAASQDSLFVSQHQEASLPAEEKPPVARATRQTRRKRQLSPLPEHDVSALMDEIAPTAAAAKRRRIESGQAPVPPSPEPEPTPKPDEDEEMVPDSPEGKPKKGQTARGRGKKIKEEDGILEHARRQREEAEAQAAAKRRELEELPDDGIDYAAIRALHIIEECEVHFPEAGTSGRSRDQDIVDGRWDPRWNGRKNFKRFRKQGETAGRQAPRIIISLEEVKPKEYGIGDDYWLEDEEGGRRKKDSQRESQPQTQQPPSQGRFDSLAKGKEKEVQKPKLAVRRTVVAIDSSDEEEPSEPSVMPEESLVPESEPSRSRTAKAAEKANSQRRSQTQTQTQSQSQAASSSNKRSAPADSNKDRAAKKPRRGFKPPSDDESDDSDDELKFRFGRRR